MKITLDKNITTINQAAKVKADMKAFKASYTDGDLLRTYEEAFGYVGFYVDDILKCELSAFPSSYGLDAGTSFSVDMVLDGYTTMAKIHFYVNEMLEVSTDDLLHSIKKYNAE